MAKVAMPRARAQHGGSEGGRGSNGQAHFLGAYGHGQRYGHVSEECQVKQRSRGGAMRELLPKVLVPSAELPHTRSRRRRSRAVVVVSVGALAVAAMALGAGPARAAGTSCSASTPQNCVGIGLTDGR